ncbi:MAG: hypothetical protein ACYDBB_26735 [Armatimonadota bacterium]
MFNWFAKKPKAAVKITKTTADAHGVPWKTVVGSDNPLLQEIVQRELDQAEQVAEPRPGMVRVQRTHGRLPMLGVVERGYCHTFYPVLVTSRAIPVTVKEIIEWEDGQSVEAQIIGSGRNTFGLSFYATDYLEHAHRYQAGGELMVSLAGLAYKIEGPPETPEGFHEQYCAYMPHHGDWDTSDFGFIGQILSVEDITICGESCHIIDVRIINGTADSPSFALELLANARHVTTPLIAGNRAGGFFWLQGRLATETVIRQQEEPEQPQQQPQCEQKQRRW